ncbi:ComF family protein [Shinella sp. HZN7]|uniref:ComF family protein n=1 Tax=Shinella sp. (strain HZN7) TaxID=879274 RepID=UPI0007DA6084|nr:ComF family protein [Shinella sp. HZN7]ANH05820.1 amidophosphoribosyltransferase [Shinella sp. HZN7]
MGEIEAEAAPAVPLRQALARRLRGLAGSALDLVYPPACAGCGVLLGSRAGLCPRCWSKLALIERPYCEVLGTPFSHDLGPGILSADAIANPPPFDRLRSVALYDDFARVLVHSLKYRDRTDLAPMMAGWMLRAGDGTVEAADAIVPVPLHRFRLLWRKFNQSSELARALGGLSGRPVLVDAVRRTKRTRRQIGLGPRAREENVRGAFTVTPEGREALFGRRVVLVDDVYTTGATVSAVTRALKRAGAADITVLTFARALPGPI